MRIRNVMLPLLLAAPLAAQVLEPSQLGVQVRVSAPQGSFRDALDSPKVPGLGASLLAELDFGDSLHLRGAFGLDRWSDGSSLTSEDREIRAYHLSAEAVYFLRDEGSLKAKGPYVVGGLGAYAWTLGKDVSGLGQSRSMVHMAGTLGLGWRLNNHLDAEIKALGGAVDPGLSALAFLVCVNYRF